MKRKQKIVSVGLIQTKADREPAKNLAKAIRLIEKAHKKGAQIVCLQELFLTPYFPQTKEKKFFQLAESIPNRATEELQRLAKKLKVVIVAPVFEKTRGVYYNSAVVIDADGTFLGVYRKMHIPYDPGFYEKFYFTPGNLGFQVFDTMYGKIGVFICWDQWFPEGARLAALKGADILFYPTAIGWDVRRKDKEKEIERSAWLTIQKSHAIANGVYVAVANRVGKEDNLQFWGSSFVAGPFGEIINEAGRTAEEILIAKCDLARVDEMRAAWPFFRDRRNNFYTTISSKQKIPTGSSLRGTK